MRDAIRWIFLASYLMLFGALFYYSKYIELTVSVIRWVVAVMLTLAVQHNVSTIQLDNLCQMRSTLQSQFFSLTVQLLTNKLRASFRLLQFFFLETLLLFRDVYLPICFPVDESNDNVLYSIIIEFSLTVIIIPLNWYISDEKVPLRLPGTWAINALIVLGFMMALLVYTFDKEMALQVWQFMYAFSVFFVFLEKHFQKHLKMEEERNERWKRRMSINNFESMESDSNTSNSSRNSLAKRMLKWLCGGRLTRSHTLENIDHIIHQGQKTEGKDGYEFYE